VTLSKNYNEFHDLISLSTSSQTELSHRVEINSAPIDIAMSLIYQFCEPTAASN
jgi:hypothetical protein